MGAANIIYDDEIEFTHEGYQLLKSKLRKINKIINNPDTEINKRIRAVDERYYLQQKIKRYKKYLRIVTEKEEDKNKTIVRLSELVADNFRSFWKDQSYTKILKGGRSSTKSSNISLKLVKEFLEDDNANVMVFRKVAKYLSTSVYEQIKWAIYKLHVQNEFTFGLSPLRITHKRTGTAFYFFGVDDPVKIKSAKIAVGYVIALWFEEASEFDSKEEIDTVADTFIREDLPNGKFVATYLSYNPPRNQYNWLNEWVVTLKGVKNVFVHHSTYKEVEKFLSKQFLEKVEEIRKNDYDYWAWMYDGQVIGIGNTVYNISLFKKINKIPDDDKLLFADIAIDGGYSVSATTFLFIGYTVKGRCILLDTYYYSPKNQVKKKAPSDFSKDLNDFIKLNTLKYNLNIDTYTIDSAEAALRNQYDKDYGQWLTPARKKLKEKMIENVEDLLAQGRVYYLDIPNNKIFYDEHKKYQWDEKTLEPGKKPEVVKEDDHTCDAFQYYVNNNLEKLRLKL